MKLRLGYFIGVVFGLLAAGSADAQRRRLGPKDRDIILDAKLDQAFASTNLKQIAFLPFGNELDYQEGAMILGGQFLDAMKQAHPELIVRTQEETVKAIADLGLAGAFRLFKGTYLNTGVATTSFLKALGTGLGIDGVVIPNVLAYQASSTTSDIATPIGVITYNRTRALVGMEIKLLRASDGRQLWWGLHAAEGQKDENVVSVSKVIASVIAQYFGRLPY